MNFARTAAPAKRALGIALLAALAIAPAARGHSPHDTVEKFAITQGATGNEVLFAMMRLTSTRGLARSFDGGASWSITAIGIEHRDVSRIAFSPGFAEDGIVLMSTTDKGILRSDDAGETWTQILGGGLDPRVNDVEFAAGYPTDPTIWAATAGGLFVSTDDGLTWVPHNSGLVSTGLTFVRPNPSNRLVLFTGKRTLHRSDDGCQSWVALQTFSDDITSISLSPDFDQDETMVVALRNGSGVFVSTNGGVSFSPLVDGLIDPKVNDVAVGRDGTVFAVSEQAAVFRGHVSGTPYELFMDGFEVKSDLTTNHYLAVAIDAGWPATPVVWVAGFEGIFRSDQAGESFRQKDVYSQWFNRVVVFPPDWSANRQLLLVSYGGGILRTPSLFQPAGKTPGTGPAGAGAGVDLGLVQDPAGTAIRGSVTKGPGASVAYQTLTQGISSIFGQCLDLSPQFLDDGTMFYSQATLWRSLDQGASWSKLDLPPGVTVLRSQALSPDFPADPTIWLGSGLGGSVYRSEDAGQSWLPASGGLPADPHPVEILPSPLYAADQTLFLASPTKGLYRSTDRGDNWTKIGTGGPPGFGALSMSPGYPAHPVFLAGGEKEGLFRSEDGGASFTDANAGLPAGLLKDVESIALSPQFVTDGTAFASILALGTYKSTDFGATWAPVGAGLPNAAPRVVEVSPDFATDRTVVVATHAWTWISQDAGASWKRLPGYERFDNSDYLHYYALGTANAATAPTPPREELPGGLGAWLATDACPGSENASAAGFAGIGTQWTQVAWPAGCHGASVSLGLLAGASAELEIFGNRVRWFAPKAPDQGIARIELDGVVVADVDLYAPVAGPSKPVFVQAFPGVAPHRIKITVTGLKHHASSGIVLRSDGFDVTF